MTADNLKKEFELRKLKQINKKLMNSNTILNRQYKNLNEHFDKRLNEEVDKKLKIIENDKRQDSKKLEAKALAKNYEKLQNKYDKKVLENRNLLLRSKIAEDKEKRLKKIVNKKESKITLLEHQHNEDQNKIAALIKEIERLKVIQNNDGTCAGIPTSATPLGKKKIIPNSRKKTGEKIGRKQGHKKDKLEKIPDELINEHIKHSLKKCPKCNGHSLEKTGKVISKDVKDYYIVVKNTRHEFIEYLCPDCGKLVHEEIPNHLKEECQYGKQVKSLALTLTNIGNVPFNKTRRILKGLSINEIEPCEGYLAKLQKQASKGLIAFIEELHKAAVISSLLYWDDTVISINKTQGCMRYYGNEDFCLFKAHEKKNKEGLDKDKILGLLSSNTVVEHDHNKVNYNPEYEFINAECCQHLLRDLKKVEINIPERTWCKDMISLFQEYDHKRNELLKNGGETFTDDEINEFIMKVDHYLLVGLEEHENNPTPYYAEKELTLIWRIMEYRDNYLYWILDFDIPFTNNLSERNLRGIKSKMKVSGQFQNINSAEDYANIRSYIETCRIYGKNEYECLSRLVSGNPYTFAELQALKK